MATDDALVVRTMSVSQKSNETLDTDYPEVVIVTNSSANDKPGDANNGIERFSSPESGEFMMHDNEKSIVVSNQSLASDLQEKVNLSWEDICVEAELPKPSLLKRCLKKDGESTKPTKKQILFDGECNDL